MTSWHKRIDNVYTVMKTLLNQTLPADEIVLNLCIQDFPFMENDLPADLLGLIEDHPQIRIYWYIENYKAWKKHLHVLEIAGDDDLIISTDDDHLYPNTFIENMYTSYCYYGKKCGVTSNRILLIHNVWCFNGPGTLYKKSFFPKNYKMYLTDDVKKCYEDTILTSMLAANGVYLLPIMFEFPKDKEMLYNDIFSFSDETALLRNNTPGDVTRDEKRDQIASTALHTVQTLVKVFDDKYFGLYPVKPNEVYFIPGFWKLHVEIIEKLKHARENNQTLFKSEEYLIDAYDKHTMQGNVLVGDDDDAMKMIGVNIPRHSKEYYIGKDNKLVITLSSWNKRIENCYKVISDILYNTMTPDEIVLNLAKPDFGIAPDKNPDLHDLVADGKFPKDLYNLIKENSIIKLNWYEDAGYRSWKKYIYSAQHYSNDDVIITIDDDVLYKETFIETMVKSYHEYGRKHPISCLRGFCQGAIGICGYAFLFTPRFLNFNKELFNDAILHKFPEDNHILNVVNYNGYPVMPVIGYNYLFYSTSFNQGDSNFGNMNFTDEWWKSYYDLIDESGKIIDAVGEGREELNLGWRPVYFNYSIAAMIKYLESHKREELSEPVQHVYDTISLYLQKHAGTNVVINELPQKIDNVIL